MGAGQSEFQEQFHRLYRFVGIVQDRVFGASKIYRRKQFNFDYVMVVQRPLCDFAPPLQAQLSAYVDRRLSLIRHYQNAYTVGLLYSRVIQGHGLGCEGSGVRLFMEYYNHTLGDYLSALRGGRLVFTLGQLIFATGSLVQAVLALRKMEIEQFSLSPRNVFVSADQGKVALNPAYLVYQWAAVGSNSEQIHQISTDYQPLDLAASTSISLRQPLQTPHHLQIESILGVFMDMARYLPPKELPQAHKLFGLLRRCDTVEEMMRHLEGPCQELNVDQFGQVPSPQLQIMYMKGEK